jgi:hypothetical protein
VVASGASIDKLAIQGRPLADQSIAFLVVVPEEVDEESETRVESRLSSSAAATIASTESDLLVTGFGVVVAPFVGVIVALKGRLNEASGRRGEQVEGPLVRGARSV